MLDFLSCEFCHFLGAANLEVKQEIQYVMPEARVMELLKVLQKTAPPVIYKLRKSISY